MMIETYYKCITSGSGTLVLEMVVITHVHICTGICMHQWIDHLSVPFVRVSKYHSNNARGA